MHPTFKEGQPAYGVPSTRIAESLGRTIVQNIVMLGFFAAVTKIVPRETMRDAVKEFRAGRNRGTEPQGLRRRVPATSRRRMARRRWPGGIPSHGRRIRLAGRGSRADATDA